MDRTTYEIVRNGLYAIAREMKIAMMRTAVSPIIHAGGDASAAIFDAEMQLVAQGNDIPTMLGSAVISVRESVNAVGRQNLRPGDVIISNDVYLGGGNHQPDVQLTRPVFVEGRIVAFTMTRGHWTDIGGQAPGSYTPHTWDIFGEGVRIPPVLLFRDDRLVEDVAKLIVQNTRDPDSRMLDIKAQYAGAYVGDRRIVELAGKYGVDAIGAAMAQSLDYSERLMRAQIAAMPDGTYYGEDFVEPVEAGEPADLIPIKVAITIAGDTITFDYTGTAKQVRGGINCPFSVTCNSTWFTVKAITDPAIPINQGCYRPVKIVAPEGSILNCTFPASVVSGNTETSPRVIDMLLTTLAKAIPDRVIAQSYDSACSAIISGPDPDAARRRALRRANAAFMDVHAGGMGARPTQDGVNGIRVYVGNTGTQSVEQTEQSFPLVVEDWSLVADSGGAGKWRGGNTARRVYRVGYEEATLSIACERGRVAPAGLFGGGAGSLFTAGIAAPAGGTRRVPAKGGSEIVHAGDRVTVQPAGSGGYGDPHERDPERVREDVLDGYVTRDAARRLYGVVLSDDLRTVDVEATAALRRRTAAE